MAIFFFGTQKTFAGEGGNSVPSVLKSATVYRSGAELVHTAKASLRQGNNELTIEDISNNIDVNSIRINCGGNVTILSVEFSREYLKPETKSASVKKLEDSVERIQKEQGKLNIVIKADNDLLDLLGSNKKIGGNQSGLSVAELSKMVDYYKQKTLELNEDIAGAKDRQDRLDKSLEKLNSQIAVEEKKNNKTSGRILLQLLSQTAGDFDFTLSYLTPSAYWNPSYDLKVDNIAEPMKLIYKAELVQTSGIDWKQVRLVLSTSVPNQGGDAPLLKTWLLQYVDPVAVMEDQLKSNTLSSTLSGKVAGLDMQFKSNYRTSDQANAPSVILRGYSSLTNEKEPLYIVNGQVVSAKDFGKIDPGAFKTMQVLKESEAAALYGSRSANGVVVATLREDLGDHVSVADNTMNVTFDIDIPYDVPTNGKEQHVVLNEYAVPVAYNYYSAPRLDKDAYLLGGVSDWAKYNLLPGEANIIFEGTYIGRSTIDPNSTLDTLNLTFGKDKRVSIKREKVVDYSSVKFLGSNKKQIFTYEITVKNNKKEEIQMQLKDQYPISSNKEIESELLESNGADVNTETGILTWKLHLAAGESKKIRISYSIKYPKDKIINSN